MMRRETIFFSCAVMISLEKLLWELWDYFEVYPPKQPSLMMKSMLVPTQTLPSQIREDSFCCWTSIMLWFMKQVCDFYDDKLCMLSYEICMSFSFERAVVNKKSNWSKILCCISVQMTMNAKDSKWRTFTTLPPSLWWLELSCVRNFSKVATTHSFLICRCPKTCFGWFIRADWIDIFDLLLFHWKTCGTSLYIENSKHKKTLLFLTNSRKNLWHYILLYTIHITENPNHWLGSWSHNTILHFLTNWPFFAALAKQKSRLAPLENNRSQ